MKMLAFVLALWGRRPGLHRFSGVSGVARSIPEWPKPMRRAMGRAGRPLEARDSRPRTLYARNRGGPCVSDHRHSHREGRRPDGARPRRRRGRFGPRASIRGRGHRPQPRDDRLATHGHHRHAARRLPPHLRQLRVELAGDRRHAHLRFLRIAWSLRLSTPTAHRSGRRTSASSMRMDMASAKARPDAARRPAPAALRPSRDRASWQCWIAATGREIWRTRTDRAVQLGSAIRRAARRQASDHRERRSRVRELRLRHRASCCGKRRASGRTPSHSRFSTTTWCSR